MSIHISAFFVKTRILYGCKERKRGMLRDYDIHTDLALEDKERFDTEQVEIPGVSVEEICIEEKEMQITTVKILSENGAKTMRKPVGTYITIEAPNMAAPDCSYREELAKELAHQLEEMLLEMPETYTVLVVGLGNREVTPDSLGPRVVDSLYVTRHIVKEYGKYAESETGMHMVSAIAPGVMAQTGMETYEIIKGIAEEVHPDLVIAIDALAARNTKRLNRTIQIADTGIHPGSGVGNHRKGITKETIGVPVIAIGVPTVVDAATIVRDTITNLMQSVREISEETVGEQMIAPHLYGMFVTPKDIDETITFLGELISDALNYLFGSAGRE